MKSWLVIMYINPIRVEDRSCKACRSLLKNEMKSQVVRLLTHPAIKTHAISSVTIPVFRRHPRKNSLIIQTPSFGRGSTA